MKRTGQVLPSRRMKIQNLKAAHQIGQPALWNKQSGKKNLLLRHPNFVAKSTDASFETQPLACEGSNPWPKMERMPCRERQMNPPERMKTNTELGLQVYLTFPDSNNLLLNPPA